MTISDLKINIMLMQKVGVLCCLSICATLLVFSIGCSQPVSEPIDMSPLMIDAEQLPERWSEDYQDDRTSQPLWEDQVVAMGLYYEGDFDKHTRGRVIVYRYSRDSRQQKSYEELEQDLFGRDDDEYIVPPYIPEQVELDLTANIWQFACYGFQTQINPEPGEACRYIAQYEQYIVFVSVNMMYGGQRIIEMAEVGELIKNVDLHISRELGID